MTETLDDQLDEMDEEGSEGGNTSGGPSLSEWAWFL